MALHLQKNGACAAFAITPAPVGQGDRKGTQQHVVDARMVQCRHCCEQRGCQSGRQTQAQAPHRGADIALWIQGTLGKQRILGREGGRPKCQLLAVVCRFRPQPLGPAPEGGSAGLQLRRPTQTHRLPCRLKIRNQNAPGDSVHGQMMDHQQQAARALVTRIKPDGLHHGACGRIETRLCRLLFFADAAQQRRLIERSALHPPQATRCVHCSDRGDLQPGMINQPQPQRIVMIQERLQRSPQMLQRHLRRHLQEHQLVEAANRSSPLQQPLDDRRGLE